jgi:hypothetical protein
MASTIFTSGTQLQASDAVVDSFLARPRNTPSARNARARDAAVAPATGAERMRAVFARLPALAQEPTRQRAYERMVIEAKVSALLERVEAGEAGDGGEDMLASLLVAARDNDAELARFVGAAGAAEVLAAIAARDMRDALRLSVVGEEDAAAAALAAAPGGGGAAAAAAAERAERLWRRALNKMTIPVRINAALRFATAHDDPTRTGHRALSNELNVKDARDELSYYQAAALKYGRTARRRGSTGVAGAWEEVFAPSGVAAYDRGAAVAYDADGAVRAPASAHTTTHFSFEGGMSERAARASPAAARAAHAAAVAAAAAVPGPVPAYARPRARSPTRTSPSNTFWLSSGVGTSRTSPSRSSARSVADADRTMASFADSLAAMSHAHAPPSERSPAGDASDDAKLARLEQLERVLLQEVEDLQLRGRY